MDVSMALKTNISLARKTASLAQRRARHPRPADALRLYHRPNKTESVGTIADTHLRYAGRHSAITRKVWQDASLSSLRCISVRFHIRYFGTENDGEIGALGNAAGGPPDDEGNNQGQSENDMPDHEQVQAAQHQIKHRLQEKVGIKVAERATERLLEQIGPESAVERAALSAMKHPAILAAAERAAGKGAAQVEVRATEAASKTVATKLAKVGVGRAAPKAIEKTSERGLDHAVGSMANHGATTIAAALGAHSSESVASQTARWSVERGMLGHVGAVPAGSNRAMEKVVKSVAEHSVERTTIEALESGADHAAASKILSRATEASVGKTLERGAESAAVKDATTLVGRGKIAIAKRLGQRTLIALPLLGGLFAAHICIQDRARCLEELSAEPRNGTAAFLFGFAALCDSVDASAHLFVALGVAFGWSHGDVLAAEYVSLAAAGASISSAIGGELLSRRHTDTCEAQ